MSKLMMTRAVLMLLAAGLSLVGMACGEVEDDHANEEVTQEITDIWEDTFVERRDGKADGGPSCSGVIVPDKSGFDKRVALTFDDGPNPETTPQVLDTLARHGIKATFFINGQRVKGDAERAILKRMIDEGHILANHSHAHKNLKTVSVDELETQIQKTHDIIIESGEDQLYFRFPFGSANCTAAQRVRDFGYTITGWHIDSADWCYASGTGGVGHCAESTFKWVPNEFRDDMVAYTMSQVRSRNGGILLFHDIHQNTADHVEPIIEKLVGEGYTFVNVDDTSAFPLLNGVEAEPEPFVGDACQAAADCDFDSGNGDCFSFAVDGNEGAFGFCTLKCEGFCPDRSDKAATFCVSLDNGVSGSCVSKAGDLNAQCESLPGTAPTEAERFIGGSTATPSTATVCLPK